MSESGFRRRPILKWILALVLVFLLSGGFIAWQAIRGATAVIRRCEEDRAQFFATLRAKDSERASIFETPIPGDAWDSYQNGFDAISAVLKMWQGGFLLGETPWKDLDDDRFGVLLVRSDPGLKLLLSGLRSTRFVPPFHYDKGRGRDRRLGMIVLYTGRFFEEAARRYRAKGRDREAINLLLVTLAMERDVSRRGGTEFLHSLRMVEWESAQILEAILASHSLGAPDLEELCGAFDKLDRLRPSVREELEIHLMMEPVDMEGDRNCRPGWGSLFSKRLHRAVSLSQYADVKRRLDEIFNLAPEHRANEAMRRKEKTEKPGSGDEALAWGTVSGVCYQDIFAALNFTLARVALALAWYQAEKGAFPAKLEDLTPRYLQKVPTCPFTGTALGYAPGKVWSIGFDGKDDGGKPISKTDVRYDYIEWSWSPLPGDVVWAVSKK